MANAIYCPVCFDASPTPMEEKCCGHGLALGIVCIDCGAVRKEGAEPWMCAGGLPALAPSQDALAVAVRKLLASRWVRATVSALSNLGMSSEAGRADLAEQEAIFAELRAALAARGPEVSDGRMIQRLKAHDEALRGPGAASDAYGLPNDLHAAKEEISEWRSAIEALGVMGGPAALRARAVEVLSHHDEHHAREATLEAERDEARMAATGYSDQADNLKASIRQMLTERDGATERCPFIVNHDDHEGTCCRLVEKPGEGPFVCTCAKKAGPSSGAAIGDELAILREVKVAARRARRWWVDDPRSRQTEDAMNELRDALAATAEFTRKTGGDDGV